MIRTDHTRHIFGRYGEPHRMRDYAYRPLADLPVIEMYVRMTQATAYDSRDYAVNEAALLASHEDYGNHR